MEIESFDIEKEHKGNYGKYTRTETHYNVVTKRALSGKDAKKLDLENKSETIAPKLTLETK